MFLMTNLAQGSGTYYREHEPKTGNSEAAEVGAASQGKLSKLSGLESLFNEAS